MADTEKPQSPKPITPQTVRNLIAAALHDMLGRETPDHRWTHGELADAVAVWALPAHERMIREQIAAENADDTLPAVAARIVERLSENFDPKALPMQQVLNLAEETGEFVGAYRRWAGMARRTGTWDDVRAELADVVITAYVTAAVLGIDLDEAWRAKIDVVFARGWREQKVGASS